MTAVLRQILQMKNKRRRWYFSEWEMVRLSSLIHWSMERNQFKLPKIYSKLFSNLIFKEAYSKSFNRETLSSEGIFTHLWSAIASHQRISNQEGPWNGHMISTIKARETFHWEGNRPNYITHCDAGYCSDSFKWAWNLLDCGRPRMVGKYVDDFSDRAQKTYQ